MRRPLKRRAKLFGYLLPQSARYGGQSFNLPTALVRAHRRAKPLPRNRPAALPEKDSPITKFSPGLFQKAAYPSPRPLAYARVLPRTPRPLRSSLSEVAADYGFGGSSGVIAVGAVLDNADDRYLRVNEGSIASEKRI